MTIQQIKTASKETLDNYVINDIALKIENGEDVTGDFILAKKMEYLSEQIIKVTLDPVLSEVRKHHTLKSLTVELKPKNSVKYAYDNSPQWVQQNEAVKTEAAKLKEIEEIAKTTTTRVDRVDETGEMLTILPAIKKVTETIECKIL